MERLNKKTLSFPAMRITRILATLGTILVLAACGKGDGGGGGAVTPIPPSSCGSCTGITSPQLLTTVAMDSLDRTMSFTNMQIYGNSTNMYPSATGNIYNTYQGPIGISGTLVVTAPQTDIYGNGACTIPVGTYYVQSNGQGVMEMGMLQVQSMITTSGSIEFAMQGMLYPNQRLYSQILVTRVNGYQCSGNFYGTFN